MVDIARLGLEIDSKQVKSATADLARFHGRAEAVGRTAQRLGKNLSLYVTAPLFAGGAMAVKTASEYERLKVQLEVLVGSAEKAEKVFGNLTEFAAQTPFELQGITQANNMLIGFGFSAERALELLDTLGDIAAVSGADLKTLARITGEARAENKLLTRDLRQLTNSGIPAYGLLAKSVGVSEKAISDMATRGEISFDILIDAFERATAAGGLYEDGMEKLSGTMSGIWSNFIDNTDMALASFGETVIKILDLKQVLKDVVDQIEDATEWFNDLSASQQKMLLTLTGITMALGPAIFLLGSLGLAISAISAPMVAVAGTVAVGTAAIINNWEEVEAYFTAGGGAEMWEELKELVDNTISLVETAWDLFGENIMSMTGATFDVIVETIDLALKQINNIVGFWSKAFVGDFKGALGEVKDAFEDYSIGIVDIAKSLGNWLWFINPPRIAITTLMNLFDQAEERAKSFGPDIMNAMGNQGLKNIFGQEWNMEVSANDGSIKWQFGVVESGAETSKKAVDNLINSIDGVAPAVKNIPPIDEILNPQGDFLDRVEEHMRLFGSSFNEAYQAVRATPPSLEEMLGLMDELSNHDFTDDMMDLPAKAFPPGSLGKLQERLAELQREMLFMTDPEGVRVYQDEIEKLQGKIEDLTGKTKEQNEMARELGFTFTSAFEDAVISGNSLRDVLQGLFKDIERIILRMTITEPLAEFLSDTISGIGSGIATSGTGSTSTTADYGSGYRGGTSLILGGNTPVMAPEKQAVSINVINQNNSEVDIQTRETPSGINVDVLVKQKVKEMVNSGQLDKELGANFGIRRGGVNRG